MPCPNMHKLCKVGCDNYVCRAFFPERQPIIKKEMMPVCQGENYAEECPQYAVGTDFKAERRRKHLETHCPFASNTVCGRPYEWWCKGGQYPFQLTLYETKEGKPRIPKRDEHGEIIFIRSPEDLKETCLSGDREVYMNCPHYIEGMKIREEYKKIKESVEKGK